MLPAPIEHTRPPGSGKCPPSSGRDRDWIEYGSDCYMFVDTPLTFGEARHACVLEYSELASIHDNNTNKFINDNIQLQDFPYSWWIGMHRTQSTTHHNPNFGRILYLL